MRRLLEQRGELWAARYLDQNAVVWSRLLLRVAQHVNHLRK